MGADKIKKLVYTTALVSAAVLLIVSIVYFFTVIIHFKDDLEKTTETIAEQMAASAADELNSLLEAELARAADTAEAIQSASTMEAVRTALVTYRNLVDHRTAVGDIRYFVDNKTGEYGYDGASVLIKSGQSRDEQMILQSNTPCFSGIYEGNYHSVISYIALWYPIEDAMIDGFMAFFKPEVFFSNTQFYNGEKTPTTTDGQNTIVQNVTMSALCSRDESDASTWKVDRVSIYSHDEFGVTTNDQIFERLNSLTHKSKKIDYLHKAIEYTKTASTTVSVGQDKYSFSVAPVTLTGGELFVIEAYDPTVLYNTSYNFMGEMEGALIFLGILFFIALLYLNYLRTHLRDKKELEEQFDSVSGCQTYRYFIRHSEELWQENPTQRYAFVMLRVNYLQYLGQLYGSDILLKIVRFIGEVMEKILDQTETYGFISDGNFAVLMHYKEEVELMNRLRMMHAIIYNFPDLKNKDNHVKVTYGVYLSRADEKIDPLACIDRAGMALRSSSFSVDSIFRFYNDELGEDSNRQAEIELKMEQSLNDGNFKVFYQPKYNLHKETIDSAEALVRWYDPDRQRFYPPGDFIQLFEENGFIVKLDHYVFETVCKFAAKRIAEGKKLSPLSINASRVTLAQPDFVRYYLSVKNKYNIPAHLLTIEYTESVAMENYEVLRRIVEELRAGGIGSSIDDFGSGFSSYNILKELTMDELKLDRFFIMPGMSAERDDALLNSIIKLAQKLGMKVTQEGVESVEMMDRLKKAGANTVQGFYYSKPIPENEFEEFLDREFAEKKPAENTDNP